MAPTEEDTMAEIPRPRPANADPEAERLHRKQMLVAAFHLFSKFGFDEGVAGHITARDPERLDRFSGQPVRPVLRPDQSGRPDPGQRPRRDRGGRRAAQHGGLRHPLPGARGPPRRDCGRPLPLALRQGVVVARADSSTRLLRMPVPSTRTTGSSTTTPAWCWTRARASASRTRRATRRP